MTQSFKTKRLINLIKRIIDLQADYDVIEFIAEKLEQEGYELK